MNSNLRIAVTSDIHLGNKRNKASLICKNLREAFPDNKETNQLDLIVLAGDVFDSLLSFKDDDIFIIKSWIIDFLYMCAKNDIMLIVLEGTPSHDWNQSYLFEFFNKTAKIGCDLRYVKELSIEYIDKFDINVLYVPDELPGGVDKTYETVLELMHEKGINKVDFAFMHGQFEYQLPSVVKAPKHDSKKYLDIVSEYIFIGHVHTPSVKDRIIAQGSFDRLCHGEEHDKGHVRLYYNKLKEPTIKFVVNKNAKIFKTINCTELSVEETLLLIDSIFNKYNKEIHIRIEADKTHPVFKSFEQLIVKYPFVIFDKLPRDGSVVETYIQIEEENYVPISITKDNIEELMMSKINNILDKEKAIIANRLLKEVI